MFFARFGKKAAAPVTAVEAPRKKSRKPRTQAELSLASSCLLYTSDAADE